MRRVLATDTAGDLYRKRQQMIEPVFADTRRLITASGNLMNLHRHQLRPAGA